MQAVFLSGLSLWSQMGVGEIRPELSGSGIQSAGNNVAAGQRFRFSSRRIAGGTLSVGRELRAR